MAISMLEANVMRSVATTRKVRGGSTAMVNLFGQTPTDLSFAGCQQDGAPWIKPERAKAKAARWAVYHHDPRTTQAGRPERLASVARSSLTNSARLAVLSRRLPALNCLSTDGRSARWSISWIIEISRAALRAG
jgi:hypothetical protein